MLQSYLGQLQTYKMVFPHNPEQHFIWLVLSTRMFSWCTLITVDHPTNRVSSETADADCSPNNNNRQTYAVLLLKF